MAFIKEESDDVRIEETFRIKHEDPDEQTDLMVLKEERQELTKPNFNTPRNTAVNSAPAPQLLLTGERSRTEDFCKFAIQCGPLVCAPCGEGMLSQGSLFFFLPLMGINKLPDME
ncbi:hypothetical protein Q8A67_007290 [Cirrhinus molitorella]|uniref:Uncharacterized protein n=1 Tax=Cirrhinus molitorella TaxID=172907 RepID=A0AA88QAK3_9TELE|nr:hypothetical protein Q8A67_007290 [Cirrhinus molitorella]